MVQESSKETGGVEGTAIDTGDGREIMLVTYDPSASMRRWASAFSSIILLKPVYADTLDHPALALDIRQKQDA